MKHLELIGALIAVAMLACGGGQKQIGQPLTWPPPPEKGRVRFVTAFSHTNDLDNSNWTGFKRSVFGGSGDPSVNQPMGLAISDDGNRLYIADMGLGKVLVADFKAKRIKPFAPDEPPGRPFDVAIDGDENLYVSDSIKREVVKLDKNGNRLLAISDDIERPTGLAVDRERKLLYVVDSASLKSKKHRVRVYDLNGKHLRDLGPADGGDTKGSGDGQVYFPIYVAVASDGSVYVGDAMNFRIQVFDAEGNFLSKYGEHGDGPGTFARLKGLDFDSFGNLYVVDAGHSLVEMFNRELQILMAFGGDAPKLEFFTGPRAIAIHRGTNRIYVSNVFSARINVYELINTTAEDSVPSDSKADEAADKPADEATDKPAGEATDKPADEATPKAVDETTPKAVDEPVDKPVDESAGEPAEAQPKTE